MKTGIPVYINLTRQPPIAPLYRAARSPFRGASAQLPDKPYPTPLEVRNPKPIPRMPEPTKRDGTTPLFLHTSQDQNPNGPPRPRSVGGCAPKRPPGPGAGVPHRASSQTGEGGSE